MKVRKARSVKVRSTFRRRDSSRSTESRIKRAIRNNRLSGKAAR